MKRNHTNVLVQSKIIGTSEIKGFFTDMSDVVFFHGWVKVLAPPLGRGAGVC